MHPSRAPGRAVVAHIRGDIEITRETPPVIPDPVRAALDLLPISVTLADREGIFRWINAHAREEFGPVVGHAFTRVIAREDVTGARTRFARKVVGLEQMSRRRVTLLLANGGRQGAEVVAVPLVIDGEVVGVLAVIQPASPTLDGTDPSLVRMPALTPRQHDVLRRLSGGDSTAEIAADLQVAPDTVRNHIRAVLRRLGVHTRLEAVVLAQRHGWVQSRNGRPDKQER